MRRFLTDINLIICFVLFAFIAVMFSFRLEGGNIVSRNQDFSTGWYYSDGEEVDFNDLRRTEDLISISKRVSPREVQGGNLCFETSNLFFDIYIDNQIVYEFHPELRRIYGEFYGEYLHTVDLPVRNEGSIIRIVYEPLVDTAWTTFRFMKLQDGADFIKSTVIDHFMHFLSSYTVFFIGVILVAFGMLLDKNRYRIIETVSLGTIAIILALWTSSGSRILQLITGNPAVVRVLDHLTLMWLPVPVILFVASVTDMLKSKITYFNLGLVGLNTVAVFTLVLLKIRDYHDMLIFTHIIIAIGVVSIVYMLISSVRKSKKLQRGDRFLLLAFFILIISGAVDAVRYYTIAVSDASLFTRIGLFVFVIVLTFYEMSNFLDINKKSMEVDIMNELAHVDGLTGLLNRLAFTEAEEELRLASGQGYILVQLDINYLKKVNDNYGHAEGDKHIKAAADFISESFGKYGKCFRIGGDEFFVILEGKKAESNFEKALEIFDGFVKKYNEENNPPVPLKVAYGKSSYKAGSDSLDAAEKAADKFMYDCKKKIKDSEDIKVQGG